MPGQIVHIEFPTADNDRAQAFWGGLFGWQFGGPMMEDYDYRMAQVNDTLGAALMPSDERGHANYYFDTGDIDATSARVRELGGEAEAKSPVPGHGWFAACKDSEGNEFHLWQADTAAAPPA